MIRYTRSKIIIGLIPLVLAVSLLSSNAYAANGNMGTPFQDLLGLINEILHRLQIIDGQIADHEERISYLEEHQVSSPTNPTTYVKTISIKITKETNPISQLTCDGNDNVSSAGISPLDVFMSTSTGDKKNGPAMNGDQVVWEFQSGVLHQDFTYAINLVCTSVA